MNTHTETTLLLTKKPDYKEGIKMPVDIYEAIKNEIMKLLDQEDGVSLPSFFDFLHPLFSESLGEHTGWYLYHVKLDLQSRGAIKVEYKKSGRNVRTRIKRAYRPKRSRSTV
jgi:hypothetical protein